MVDIVIILIILLSGVIGLKRGFTKELVCFLGFFFVIILSFILKNPVSAFFYNNLPFFKFSGLFKGITSINILLYEVLAFFIVVSILLIILRVIIFATTIFEKILKLTFILGLPSKILGFIIGLIEGIVWSFIILFVVSLPLFNIKIVNDSKIKKEILNKTPILTNITNDTVKSFEELEKLKEDYKNKKITNNEFDLETVDVLLKYKVISIPSLKKLVKDKKVNIKNINKIIVKYEEK
jgi:uncharacterized membrane protein required for colicin V production